MLTPLPATIPHLVVTAARQFGEAPAIIAEDGEAWSFRRLAEDAARAGRAFMAEGVSPGDRVAIWAPNTPQWIIATLGLQMAGGILVTMNTRFKAAEAAQILRTSGARVLVAAGDFLRTDYLAYLDGLDLPALRHRISLPAGKGQAWEDFIAGGQRVLESALDARLRSLTSDDISDMLFTSGTTGQPKGVLTTHGQNVRQYATYAACLGLRAGDRYLIVNPFFHSFGYKAGWLTALISGATTYPHAIFDAEKVLHRIERERITVMPAPPTVFQSLLAAPYREHDISSLRVVTTGSTMVPVDLVRRMRSDLGIDVVLTAYGLSESSGVVTVSSPEDDPETIATTVGRPIDGIEVKIVDHSGAMLPPGKSGELLVRSYYVMKGYHNAPEATAEAIDAEGWLHTGDIAIADTRGYLRISGRKKDMFIVGGFNCYPAEIENILLSHPAIAEAAVIGVPDERLGEVAKAFLVLEPGQALTDEEVITWSRAQMANFKVPRTVEFRSALPKNAAGKVEKTRLRVEAIPPKEGRDGATARQS